MDMWTAHGHVLLWTESLHFQFDFPFSLALACDDSQTGELLHWIPSHCGESTWHDGQIDPQGSRSSPPCWTPSFFLSPGPPISREHLFWLCRMRRLVSHWWVLLNFILSVSQSFIMAEIAFFRQSPRNEPFKIYIFWRLVDSGLDAHSNHLPGESRGSVISDKNKPHGGGVWTPGRLTQSSQDVSKLSLPQGFNCWGWSPPLSPGTQALAWPGRNTRTELLWLQKAKFDPCQL